MINFQDDYNQLFLQKKSALDEQLKKTIQQLERKLIENLELQKIWNNKTQTNHCETD